MIFVNEATSCATLPRATVTTFLRLLSPYAPHICEELWQRLGEAELIAHANEEVVLSHGNGPIVGNILIRNEAARDQIPPMPLDVCGADSQGGIGYLLQQVGIIDTFNSKGFEDNTIYVFTSYADGRPAQTRPSRAA